MKHTPGPWYAHKYTPAGIAWHVSTRADDDDNQFDYMRVCRTTDSETAEADARLIAAAPDLLAACERALDLLNEQNAGDKPSPIIVRPSPTIVRLTTAIAKAKGGAA